MLPTLLSCREFVNADEIACGLSPFQPEPVIRRRYELGLRYFFGLYLPAVDKWGMVDSSAGPPVRIAEDTSGKITVWNQVLWQQATNACQ